MFGLMIPLTVFSGVGQDGNENMRCRWLSAAEHLTPSGAYYPEQNARRGIGEHETHCGAPERRQRLMSGARCADRQQRAPYCKLF